jgi:O-methyltransferase
MTSARVGRIGKMVRVPWYWLWHFTERVLYHNREYTLQLPFGHRVLTPWFYESDESRFARAFSRARQTGPLTVSSDRCYILYKFADLSASLIGDMAECGVYTGGTAFLLASVIQQRSKGLHLHLFDTFSGMPSTSKPERDYHSPGDFSNTSLNLVQARLADFSDICEYHVGIMPDTFAEVTKIKQYSFVHVDVDIYPSILACCQWFWPKLTPGGVMLFDDYGFYPYRLAARAAVDEFFGKEGVIVLPTGQAVAIKPPIDGSANTI